MVNLLSRLISKKYLAMTQTEHSELRLSSGLADVDPGDMDISEESNLDIQVGYTFAKGRRIRTLSTGKSYSSDLSFDEIYEILTDKNDGEPFIDRYFDTIFKSRFESSIRKQTRSLLSSIDNEYEDLVSKSVYTKSGKLDQRFTSTRKLKEFSMWKSDTMRSGFDALSLEIKKHIQQCLATGRIPLNFSPKPSTIARRKKLGLTPVRAFFATGQLIDNLVVSYTADWRK